MAKPPWMWELYRDEKNGSNYCKIRSIQ
ncbi:uncharacterized protein FTOL_13875 [Fusarium torulosum]|uniref:Uncharacterized protein n=1 Tax=Fusarium torulosum TaxID=33205 RepID=A0AAE8SQA9_9HYPO|nr:uncharacterized protein FTOL_13875 [Fusarium torulosum]